MENKNIQKTTVEESSDIFAVAEDQDKQKDFLTKQGIHALYD